MPHPTATFVADSVWWARWILVGPQTHPRGSRVASALQWAVLSLLHFVDHAIRGDLVLHRGLDLDWNHSGWPFNTRSDQPYIFPISFVVVFGLLLGGILFTLRGRLWAGYWLATSIAIGASGVRALHWRFTRCCRAPNIIAMSHPGAVARVLALSALAGLFAVVAALGIQAVRTRQLPGRW